MQLTPDFVALPPFNTNTMPSISLSEPIAVGDRILRYLDDVRFECEVLKISSRDPLEYSLKYDDGWVEEDVPRDEIEVPAAGPSSE